MAQWLKDQVCNWRIAGFLSVPVLSQQKKKCFGFGLDQEVMRLVFNTRVFHRFLKCNNSDLAVKFVCLRNRNCWCSDLCPPLEVFTFFFSGAPIWTFNLLLSFSPTLSALSPTWGSCGWTGTSCPHYHLWVQPRYSNTFLEAALIKNPSSSQLIILVICVLLTLLFTGP